MCLEDIFLETAIETEQQTVILCDRGVMDGKAYTSNELWQALLDETQWNTIQLRDKIYEAVIHMVTAADGAEQFYTLANNEARYETVDEAKALDKKLINSYVGHPNIYIVDNRNEEGFQGKIQRTVDAVCQTVGLPTQQSHHKKFILVAEPGNFDIDVPNSVKKEVFEIEEIFLIATKENTEALLKKIGKNDSYIYYHEVKTYVENQRIMKKRQLSARQYIEMLDQTAKGFVKVKKFRQCFTWESQYFVVETLLNVDQQFSLLRIESSKAQSQLQIPKFVKILKDVTRDDHYSSSSIAKQGWKMPEADKKEMMKILYPPKQTTPQKQAKAQ